MDSVALPPRSPNECLREAAQILQASVHAKQLGTPQFSGHVICVFDISGSTKCKISSQDRSASTIIYQMGWQRMQATITSNFRGLKKVSVCFFGAEISDTVELTVTWVNSTAKVIFPEKVALSVNDNTTNTHLGLFRAAGFSHVILFTDGLTNSMPQELQAACDPLIQQGTRLTVEVVADKVLDLTKTVEGDFGRIPGLDLIGHIQPLIDRMNIMCKNHYAQPFLVFEKNSSKTIATYTILGVEFPKTIPLWELLSTIMLSLKKGPVQHDLAFELVCDIFGILSDWDTSILTNASPMVNIIVTNLRIVFPQHNDEIIEWAQCATMTRLLGSGLRTGMRAALEIFQKADQKKLYAMVSDEMKVLGTKGAPDNCVVFPSKGKMIISSSQRFTQSFKTIPNCFDDKHNMACIWVEPGHTDIKALQYARQALRKCAASEEFPAAEGCTEVLCYLIVMMMQMLLTGVSHEHESIVLMRRYARIQWSMTIPSLTDPTAHQARILDQLLAGLMPETNQGTLETILSKNINLIGLLPKPNWAVLSALLGPDVFDAQKHHFQAALEELRIEPDAKSVIDWLVRVYSPYAQGKFSFVNAVNPQCFMTLETLVGPAKRIRAHQNCDSGVHISNESFDNMAQNHRFGPNYCPFCPSPAQYDDVVLPNPEDLITAAETEVVPFRLLLEGVTGPGMAKPGKSGLWSWKHLCIGEPPVVVEAPIVRSDGAAMAGGGAAMAAMARGGGAGSSVLLSVAMYAVFMIGNVGAGKSTMRLALLCLLQAMGFHVVVVNMDKLSKAGKQKQATQIFQNDVERGEKLAQSKNMPFVVIFDLCNEKLKAPNWDSFGMKIRGKYKCTTFMPNFFPDDVIGYQAWTLSNVIGRPRPITEDDHWFLTTQEVGLETCIKVANNKLSAMLSTNGFPAVAPLNESMSEPSLRAFLQPHAERYAKRIAEQGTIDDVASKFIKENIVGK